MTKAAKVVAEETLPAACNRLSNAVHGFVHPRTELIDGRLHESPSRWGLLLDAVPAARQERRRGVPGSAPTIHCAALDLVIGIDAAVASWQPDGADTPDRLQVFAARPWAPPDAPIVDSAAGQVEAWSVRIDDLLEPPRRLDLAAACPACGARVAYRKDRAGETVRQAALQITVEGCVCQRCGAAWGPERFLFLAKVLGYEMPEGVLE